jgi:hypothetical protein
MTKPLLAAILTGLAFVALGFISCPYVWGEDVTLQGVTFTIEQDSETMTRYKNGDNTYITRNGVAIPAMLMREVDYVPPGSVDMQGAQPQGMDFGGDILDENGNSIFILVNPDTGERIE